MNKYEKAIRRIRMVLGPYLMFDEWPHSKSEWEDYICCETETEAAVYMEDDIEKIETLVQRSVPKEPVDVRVGPLGWIGRCPTCKVDPVKSGNACPNNECRQSIDWRKINEVEY